MDFSLAHWYSSLLRTAPMCCDRMRRSGHHCSKALKERLRRTPALCAVCRSGTVGSLCSECEQRFATPRWRCGGCALPWAGAPDPLGPPAPLSRRCGACLVRPFAFDGACAAVDYAFPWDGLLRRLKFQASPELAPMLASRLTVTLTGDPQATQLDAVIPLPSGRARIMARGYDPTWELARQLGRQLRMPVWGDVLQRVKDKPQQSRLSAVERRINLRGAFAVKDGATKTIQGARVALVDDVMTTGSTAQEAADTLKRAGVAQVLAWVVARTPTPGQA